MYVRVRISKYVLTKAARVMKYTVVLVWVCMCVCVFHVDAVVVVFGVFRRFVDAVVVVIIDEYVERERFFRNRYKGYCE